MTLWSTWVKLLSRQETGNAQAYFRIAIGVCLLWMSLGEILAGTVDVMWIDQEAGGYRNFHRPPWLFDLIGTHSLAIWSVLCVTILSAIALILGLWPQFFAMLALLCWLNVSRLNGHAVGSYDALLRNALWLLVFSQSAATCSLSCRLRTGSWWSTKQISSWPRYLGICQLVIMYVSTGLQKVSVHWIPTGDKMALWYILQQPSWARRDMLWLADWAWLTQMATFISWTFEMAAPLLLLALWFEATADRGGRMRSVMNRVRWRKMFIIVGVAIHLGIWLSMDVGAFSGLALSFYFCLQKPRLRGAVTEDNGPTTDLS